MNKLLLVIVASGMAACNVDENDGPTNRESNSTFTGGCVPRSYEEMSIYGYGCSSSGSSSGSGVNPDETAADTSRTANIARYEEYEPNNIPENANLVTFPTVSGDDLPGIEISGSVLDVSDESDYFILSPHQSGDYAVYLCADTCTEHPTDSMVAITIIDQFGAEIAGTALYMESMKIVKVNFG